MGSISFLSHEGIEILFFASTFWVDDVLKGVCAESKISILLVSVLNATMISSGVFSKSPEIVTRPCLSMLLVSIMYILSLVTS